MSLSTEEIGLADLDASDAGTRLLGVRVFGGPDLNAGHGRGNEGGGS